MRGRILATIWTMLFFISMTASQNCSGVFTTYVVVDGSASISSENFRRVKEALKIYINGSINTNSAVKIGVVVYSVNVTKVIRASSNIASLNNDVDDIVHPQSGTATNLGIDRGKELLLTDPSKNPMVMIVITDGLSQQGDLTINSSQEARDVGIAMIAVGVTGVFNAFPSIKRRFEAELQGIAGSNETVVLVKDFSELVNDLINISRRICRVVILIQQQLEDRTVLVGSNPVFRTTLSQADIRTGTWTWQERDLKTNSRYVITVQGNVQTLTIPNVQPSQSGNYTFTIGTIPTTATLTVLDLITDVTVGAGGTATFRTTVSPSSAGFWSKDGNRIYASSKYVITENGGNRELRITGVEMSDRGRYSYTVNGVSTVASLTVEAVIVHGGYTLWSPWIDITPCLATCGNNALKTARRTRTCTNPTPANGGNDCQQLGPSSETTTVDCGQSIRCAVDGGVGQWGAWSSVDCPVTCGFSPDGVRNRSRLCDSPEPSGGGRDCTDSLVERETRPCNAGQCPIDGGISPWTSWGPAVCNVTCGGNIIGVSTRERLCNRPIPSPGGKNCTESRSETIPARCILPPCPDVEGGFSDWGPWDNPQCSGTCGGGRKSQRRSRKCDNPPPPVNGRNCTGSFTQVKETACYTPMCDMAGLCNNTKRVDGVGYRYHPTDCDKYIQCYYNPNGDAIGVYRSCPFDQFWDQDNIRCDRSRRVSCPFANCNDTCDSSYKMDGSCRSYWTCGNKRSEGKCCPQGFSYQPGLGCRPNDSCDDFCSNPYVTKDVCKKRPMWNNNSASYEVSSSQYGWIEDSCLASNYFSIMDCGCAQERTCDASHLLTFDSTSFPSWVTSSGMTVMNGAAYFGVNSRMSLNITMNIHDHPSGVKVRFRESSAVTQRQVLASSIDCRGGSNFVLSLHNDGVHFEVTTGSEDISVMTISTSGIPIADWKTASLVYDGHFMLGIVESGNIKYMGRIYAPRSNIPQCGLRVATDGSSNSAVVFTGSLDMLSIYPCDPGALFQNYADRR